MADIQTVPCQYKTGRILGQGTCAVVKEAQHIKTEELFAVKIINKKLMEGREHMVRNEINLLKKVSQTHKNIVTLVDYFETANNLYLVIEWAHGGELFDRILDKGSYHERDAVNLVRSIMRTVVYMHDNGIVHRHLKKKILIFLLLVLAFLGLLIQKNPMFSPPHVAPEIFKTTGHSKPVDIWAIGIITYFLLCGYIPFRFDRDGCKEAILRADYKFEPLECWEGISDTAKDFIGQLLKVDPEIRFTAHQALAHPWLSKV